MISKHTSVLILLFILSMKRSVGKLPLLGLIRLLAISSYKFLVLLSLLRGRGIQAFHAICILAFDERLIGQMVYVLLDCYFIVFTANALVVSMSNGNQNHQTLRVFQVIR